MNGAPSRQQREFGRKRHKEETMKREQDLPLSRRTLIKGASAAAFVIATGAIINPLEAWGLEVKALKPETMQTLIQMARDIYPHDRVADRFYAVAVKDFDTKAAADAAMKSLVEDGIAKLDELAQAKHGVRYVDVAWEAQRVAILRQVETSELFQKVRSGLVVSLYNQNEIWPIFGYQGESFSQGGYINRGFNDITWL
jgi:Gluconate 2-dehydrogenase subunit 3